MKFHFIAGALLLISGYLVYRLLFGFQSDLESARPKIQQESVKSLREEKKVASNTTYAPYINKNLVHQEVKKEPIQVAEAPQNQSTAEERYSGEKNYWCRPVPVQLETNPVKCLYPDSCFGCDGPIIRPDYEDAVPLCADGNRSQLYHIECCPNFTGGEVICPSNEECFRAENVPKEFCSCGDRSDCKLVQIGSKIECLCIQ